MTRADWLLRMPIAHRGLHGPGAPELSRAALERAIEAGIAVEIDVRLASDGTVFVIHDADTERVTGVHRVVAETDTAGLQALPFPGSPDPLLTLGEALVVLGGRVPLLVELKHGVAADVIGPSVLACLRGYPGVWAVQSFDPRIVRWFGRHAPHVVRGQIAGDLAGEGLGPLQRRLLETMALNVVTRPDFLAYDVEAMPRRAVTFWRRVLRCPLVVWTVRSEQQRALAASWRAGVIFEDMSPPTIR